MAEETNHHILFYDYVKDIVERRDPFRAAHLAHIAAEKAAGRMLLGGALGDPVHGGAFVFAGVTPEDIDAYASSDPYAQAGLILAWRIERWNLV